MATLAGSSTGAPSASPVSATATMGASAAATPANLDTLPGDINLRERLLELIGGGSSGEKIARGFLIGVAFGLIVGGFCCCWVPCFGRAQLERRRRRREERIRRGEPPESSVRERMPWPRRRQAP
ncbi:Uncharacterized protein TCAP_01130 [Tolypocladium capitatum]|uniref:Transmembrane protein n=1 Tax=Tolypocladium capitatum TaxID=45235 RepID=A0A2K3QN31_9HYPO|nr:Uncharacterized protein TCAP_01130 [Tolypocladium capitatum]